MKPTPVRRTHAATCSQVRSIRTPSASSTSAAPERDVTPRLPCFATGTPAPATTKAAVVEMLKVCRRSPPVPTTSTTASRSPRSTQAPSRRMVVANPTTSSMVSPLVRSAMRNAAACTSPTRPCMSSSTISPARWRPRSSPTASASSARLSCGRGAHPTRPGLATAAGPDTHAAAVTVPRPDGPWCPRPAHPGRRRSKRTPVGTRCTGCRTSGGMLDTRLPAGISAHLAAPTRTKLRSRSLPTSVRMLSGWNWTPSTTNSRCRTPMSTPSSVHAVRSSTAGRSGATTSEWYRVATNGRGNPA